jgi:hypothetical protein
MACKKAIWRRAWRATHAHAKHDGFRVARPTGVRLKLKATLRNPIAVLPISIPFLLRHTVRLCTCPNGVNSGRLLHDLDLVNFKIIRNSL